VNDIFKTPNKLDEPVESSKIGAPWKLRVRNLLKKPVVLDFSGNDEKEKIRTF